jgi:hypothetical protein
MEDKDELLKEIAALIEASPNQTPLPLNVMDFMSESELINIRDRLKKRKEGRREEQEEWYKEWVKSCGNKTEG